MMRYKILCTDGFAKSGRDIMEANPIFEVTYIESLKHEELVSMIESFDGLVVRGASKITKDVIERAVRLKVIARGGAGTDNIDMEEATKKGILVINAPSGNSVSVAELVFGMMISLSRHIHLASRSMSEGRWEKKKFHGVELACKTIGIIGLGRIGREVAKRAGAFGMNVLGCDPLLPEGQFEMLGVKKTALEEIYRNSDYITIHTPLTKETENMITARELKMMKPSAYVINCARGGVVNEDDLAAALRDKVIAGAALDVFTVEPYGRPIFRGFDNCITTPHIGASTEEAQDAVARDVAEAMAQFFTEGYSANSVNLPGADPKVFREYKGYFLLAGRLGETASGLHAGGINKITFAAASRLPYVLTLSAVRGVLSNILNEQVTFVNAAATAVERGITVTEEVISSDHSFKDAIGVKLSGEGGEISIWGTIFADGRPKIIRYNDYNIEIDPVGTILFIQNADEPGVIGRVATILGGNNINIAEMQNVRKERGIDALTIISVDGRITDDIILSIQRERGIKDVRLVNLQLQYYSSMGSRKTTE